MQPTARQTFAALCLLAISPQHARSDPATPPDAAPGLATVEASYAEMTEPHLLLQEQAGDRLALGELHARMMGGSLSDASTDAIVDRAITMIDAVETPWDERWGDAIVMAMTRERLSEAQFQTLLERWFVCDIEARAWVNPGDDRQGYRALVYPNPRTKPAATNPMINESGYRLTIQTGPKSAPRVPGMRVRIGGAEVYFSNWTPSRSQYADVLQSVLIPEGVEFPFTMETYFTFLLYKDDQFIHEWTTHRAHVFTRPETPRPYSAPIADEDIIASLAPKLGVGFIQVPIDRAQGRPNFGTEDCHACRTIIVWERQVPWPEGAAILFDAYVRVNDQEIHFASIDALKPGSSFHLIRGGELDRTMLDYFDRHEAFWEKALAANAVDLILRPNPGLASRDPRYTRHVDASLIFRDVPLMRLVPVFTGDRQSKTDRRIWQWTQQHQRSYRPVFAEILPTEE